MKGCVKEVMHSLRWVQMYSKTWLIRGIPRDLNMCYFVSDRCLFLDKTNHVFIFHITSQNLLQHMYTVLQYHWTVHPSSFLSLLWFIQVVCTYTCCPRYSGIPLGYGLDDRGFESRQGLGIVLFSTASRPALGPTQPPIQWVPGALSMGVKRQAREADHSPPSNAGVKRMREAIPPLSQYAFMASRSVKSTGRTLPLYFPLNYFSSRFYV
jgi:hypothetical protein